MHEQIESVLFPERRIQARIHELGEAITRDLEGQDLVFLVLLKGSVIFFADLVRAIGIPVKVEFAWVASYGDSTTSSETVQLKVFPNEDLSGKTVVIVDDIVDTGRTLAAVVAEVRRKCGAERVLTCVLLDKALRRVVPVEPDYVGFDVEDVFVVGYGLDYADHYRNLPYIGVLKAGCSLSFESRSEPRESNDGVE